MQPAAGNWLPRATFQTRPRPSEASAARQLARAALFDHDRATVETVELLVTELFANAFRHARSGPSIEIDVSQDAAAIRVTVADDSPVAPRLEQQNVSAESGRGLHLVDQLASRWGWEPTRDGKRVWFIVE